jgi:hypothetical protein
MSRPSREAVFTALFALTASVPGLLLRSRELKALQDVAPEELPCLFQTQDKQHIKYTGLTPSANNWGAHWIIYAASSDPAVPASTVLNNAVDAALAALVPLPGFPKQTLGGLVEYAGVHGDIELFDGLLGNKAIAVIPITIVLGGF